MVSVPWHRGQVLLPLRSPLPAPALLPESDEGLFRSMVANGKLSREAAIRILPSLGLAVTPKYIEGVWSMYDVDGDGALDREEFGRLMHVLRRGRDVNLFQIE